MPKTMTFEQVADAADHLSLEEQETLSELLRKRSMQARRRKLAREIRSAQKEHASGKSRQVTVDELMREIRR